MLIRTFEIYDFLDPMSRAIHVRCTHVAFTYSYTLTYLQSTAVQRATSYSCMSYLLFLAITNCLKNI